QPVRLYDAPSAKQGDTIIIPASSLRQPGFYFLRPSVGASPQLTACGVCNHHCFCRLKLGWPQGAVSALRYVHHDFKRTPVLKVQSPDDLIPSERLVKVPVYDGVPIPAAVRDVVPMNDGSAVRV